MRLLYWGKDGGKESRVWGFWPIELKRLFSLAILVFEDGSREAYHDHAFNAISWVLKGHLTERLINGTIREYRPSLKPVYTPRQCFHKVSSTGRTYALTFRGPWRNTWHEFREANNELALLTHGRVDVAQCQTSSMISQVEHTDT